MNIIKELKIVTKEKISVKKKKKKKTFEIIQLYITINLNQIFNEKMK